jgi:nucleotide-binding universal stress UspA family protein
MSQIILVPIDLTDCSEEVVQRAAKLAREAKSEVLLLHVARLPEGIQGGTLVKSSETGQLATAKEHLIAEALASLAPYKATLEEHGITTHPLVKIGDPAEQILLLARQHDAGTIIMGTHGRSGFARFVFGSIAENVIRRSEAPVMVVRTRYKEGCTVGSCAWCPAKGVNAEQQLVAEAEG